MRTTRAQIGLQNAQSNRNLRHSFSESLDVVEIISTQRSPDQAAQVHMGIRCSHMGVGRHVGLGRIFSTDSVWAHIFQQIAKSGADCADVQSHIGICCFHVA